MTVQPSVPSPGEAVGFRPLIESDVSAVAVIERAVSPDPWSESLFAGELVGSGGDRHWMVAVDHDQQILGFGGLLFVTDEVHVMNVAVAPAYQRQGIASRLLSQLLLAAGDRGSSAATLEVRASNRAALAMYERFGFAAAGRRPRYYSNGEDAVIMWAHGIYHETFRQRLEELRGSHV